MGIQSRGYHPQITAMMNSMDRRDELRRRRKEYEDKKAENYRLFGALMDALKMVDPAGWEKWYDNTPDIPDEIVWAECEPQIIALANRVAEVLRERTKEGASGD